jgi:hypothetical protein
MLREKDFDAWELNGTEYEYCLDPRPYENKFDLKSRAESLNMLAPILPVALDPKGPLDGWIHFVLNGIDPEKLNNNQTYNFSIIDSMGEEHKIRRSAGKSRLGEVTVRAKKLKI